MSRGEFGSRRPRDQDDFGGGSEYDRLYKQVGNNVQQINNNVNVMQKMVKKLGTTEDAMQVQDRLQQTEKTTKSLAGETNSMLKQLAFLESDDPSEQKQRKVQVGRLRDNFMSALNNFQSIQREAAERERACVSRARAASNMENQGNFGPSDSKGISYDKDQSTNIQIQQEDEVAVELIEERERAIRQLESDIMDVNEIFRDLGTMIHEQGEIVDNIESHVESAGSHVEDANVQLAKASEYQKASRRKMCCLLVILLVVGGIIGIIIWQTTK
ncbi:syntaxin-7-like isoform X2 [Dendronephthya gigantea]|uniref:syntaxin-7-like isoform X2 n=1 Tax=Dendronephthya gigantea TaxID=151771 RepID=UPI00106AE2B1|nr:syntaxin-7-like isoform X2 [Dendronephthya gigantea]